MTRIASIRIGAFNTLQDTTVRLPVGVTCLTGPNGAGKSSVIEAVAWALWGKTLRGAAIKADSSVTVSTQHGDVSRSKTGGKTVLDIGERTADTTAKTQAVANSIFGSFDAWRRSCVFSSADAAHFSLAPDRERKALIEAALGMNKFDDALTTVKESQKALQERLSTQAKEVTRILHEMNHAAAKVESYKEILESMGADAPATQQDTEALEDAIANKSIECAVWQAESAKLSAAWRAAELQLASIQAEIAALRVRRPKQAETECKACGRPYDNAAEASEAFYRALADFDASMNAMKSRASEVASTEEDLRSSLEALGPDPRPALGRLQADLMRIRAKNEAVEAERVEREKRLASVREDLVKYTALQAAAQESYTAAQKEYEDLNQEASHLETMAKLFGTRGARVLYLERALATLEHNANAYLAKLGSSFTVQVRGQREKATGELSDVIDIKIVGDDSVGEEYAALSGGQRRRVDIALLLGLGGIVGSNVDSTLFFDEVFDALDATGVTSVCELVKELAQTRPVVVITHSNTLADRLGGTKIQIGV